MIAYRLTDIHLDDDFFTLRGVASEAAPSGEFTEIGFKFSLKADSTKTLDQLQDAFFELASKNIPAITHPTWDRTANPD